MMRKSPNGRKRRFPKWWASVCWSTEWQYSNPWSMGGRDMPYVGWRRDPDAFMLCIGPLALMVLSVKDADEKPNGTAPYRYNS